MTDDNCANGATQAEIIGAITHLALSTGWPKAMAAMAIAKEAFTTSTTPAARTIDRAHPG